MMQGIICILRPDSHEILQSLGFRNKQDRQEIIQQVLQSEECPQEPFLFKDTLQIVQKWKAETLYAHRLRRPHLIKCLLNIDLAGVQQISLSVNNISSIEQLTSLQVSDLRLLDISWNKLTNLQALKKVQWTNLESLGLSWNYFHNLQMQTYLQGNMRQFNMNTNDEYGGFEDQRWMTKVESSQVRELSVFRYGIRTKVQMSQRLTDALKDKFKNAKIIERSLRTNHA